MRYGKGSEGKVGRLYQGKEEGFVQREELVPFGYNLQAIIFKQ